ncbi:MAG TPA: hypothetical protein VFU81_22500 [Thermomicrobiales bacterium]|nr:hypothetical protein [Thermomicrobiales bacterium]
MEGQDQGAGVSRRRNAPATVDRKRSQNADERWQRRDQPAADAINLAPVYG